MTGRRPRDEEGDLPDSGRGRGRGRSRCLSRGSLSRSQGSLPPAPQQTSPPSEVLRPMIGRAYALPPDIPLSPPLGGTPTSGGSDPSVASTFVPATTTQGEAEGETLSASSGTGRKHQFCKLKPKDNPEDRFLIGFENGHWIVPHPNDKIKDSSGVVGEVAAIMKTDWKGPWYNLRYLETMAKRGHAQDPTLTKDELEVAKIAMQQIPAWEHGIRIRFTWDPALEGLIWEEMSALIRHKVGNIIAAYKSGVKSGRIKTPWPTWTDQATWTEMRRLMAEDARYTRTSIVNTQNRTKYGPIGMHKTGRRPHTVVVTVATEIKGAPLTLEENISVRYGSGDRRVPLVVPLVAEMHRILEERYGPDETNPARPQRPEDILPLMNEDQRTNHNRVRLVPRKRPADMGFSRSRPRGRCVEIREPTRPQVEQLEASLRQQQRQLDRVTRELCRLQRVMALNNTGKKPPAFTLEDHAAVDACEDPETLSGPALQLHQLQTEMATIQQRLKYDQLYRRMHGFAPDGPGESASSHARDGVSGELDDQRDDDDDDELRDDDSFSP